MKRLVAATNNKGKIKEISALLAGMELLSLGDIGFTSDIPEPYDSFEMNAYTKAKTVADFCGIPTFADDSGLCVNALSGRPGVHSAYYSGERDDEKNLRAVLRELDGAIDRSAFYKAVICLVSGGGQVDYFEGICEGTVIREKRGTSGFGYDPVFVPSGYSLSFGELPLHVKNAISHRGKAVAKLAAFLDAIGH